MEEKSGGSTVSSDELVPRMRQKLGHISAAAA